MRAGAYYMQSDCQHYTVSKVSLDADRWEYVAWFKADRKADPLLLGVSEHPEVAKQTCMAHYKSMEPFK